MAGAWAGRIGERPLIVGGLVLQAAGFAGTALAVRAGLGYPALIGPLALAGCGASMAMPAAQSCVLGAVPAADLGKAAGTFNTLRQLGGTFGIAVLAAVFTGTGSYASAQAFSRGFVATAFFAAGLSFAGALAGSAIPAHAPASNLPAPDHELVRQP